ncbi:iron complex transport system permease protein [Methanococcoides vulcani]|uniref:Iron complex transport system permease protein n=1 Tax=Methanococcoides vulcani TaxID=1353158 RepID=A0A1H9Y7V7_9EURY|nr:iron chelate uptake ABC transporter family permease subunit [Methanococcoides vulcani]SES64895.1 iron complex transport system permease protein [Methanococcoides vulcani]
MPKYSGSIRSVIIALAVILLVVVVSNTAIGTTNISPVLTAKIIYMGLLEWVRGTISWTLSLIGIPFDSSALFSSIVPDNTWTDGQEKIIMGIRLPRVILAALVGAALATAGCSMQGLLKNPLADPYIIGMSSGAALGAAIGFTLMLPTQLISFIIATITIFVVYNISKVGGKVPVDTLLLAGIAISFFLSALTSFFLFFSESLHQIIYWMMGGFWNASWDKVKITMIIVLAGIGLSQRHAWNLNTMLLGEEQAQSLGVNVESVKKQVLVISALITAAAVSVSGIVGFVGLIIPHIMRNIIGPDHRGLLPASTLMGATFLVLSDTFARTFPSKVQAVLESSDIMLFQVILERVGSLQGVDLPVGIVTALFGAPFFVYLLRKRRKSLYA